MSSLKPLFLAGTVVLSVLLSPVCAAESGVPVVVGRHEKIWSELLQESRPLLVHLPAGYEDSRECYPVLYLLDGDRSFEHASAAVDFLADCGRIPAMIVVAVPNTDRSRDLTPPPRDPTGEKGRNFGAADRFLDFLTTELAPWVEQRYRPAPFRLLVGHSRGGLFTVRALLERPAAFNAYIAVSPALWWNDRALLRDAEARLTALPAGRFLYFSAGHESQAITGPATELEALLRRLQPAGLDWHYRYAPKENHYTNLHPSIYEGLETIFSGLQVPAEIILEQGLAGIDAHYAGLEKRYGLAIRQPRGFLFWASDYLLQQRQPEKALAVTRRLTELYPQDPESWSRYAGTLAATNRNEEAREALQRAYSRAMRW